MATDIVICTTCERFTELLSGNDPAAWLQPAADAAMPGPGSGRSRGMQLFDAVADRLGEGDGDIRLRRVDCLGRCLSPGNVDLVGRGRVRVEITALWPEDADALLEAARVHAAVADLTPDMLGPSISPRSMLRLPTRQRAGRRD